MGETLRVVAGIGCRRGVTTDEVEAALAAALAAAAEGTASGTALPEGHPVLSHIATPEAKGHEPAIKAVADARGIPLVLITQADLEANNARTMTRSSNSMQAMNVHSVAEAAALAAAGTQSHLLGPRISVGPVTCALATARPGQPAGAPAAHSSAAGTIEGPTP